MSKRRKTRQQKIIARLRRNLQLNNQETLQSEKTVLQSFALTNAQVFDTKAHSLNINTNNKTYPVSIQAFVVHDLRKTIFLTASIIAAEITLFLLLRNNLVKLPMVSF